MSERVVTLQRRVRTTALAAVLGLVLLLVVNVDVILANTTNGHATPVGGTIVALAVLVLVLVLFLAALRIVVRVVTTSQGPSLEVLYGPGGFIRQIFKPEEILSASTREVSFFQDGGWGYRGSLVLLRRATLATRSGAALEIDLTRGRRFTVAVDDPEDFVRALKP